MSDVTTYRVGVIEVRTDGESFATSLMCSVEGAAPLRIALTFETAEGLPWREVVLVLNLLRESRMYESEAERKPGLLSWQKDVFDLAEARILRRSELEILERLRRNYKERR